jgi:hypothetical protein
MNTDPVSQPVSTASLDRRSLIRNFGGAGLISTCLGLSSRPASAVEVGPEEDKKRLANAFGIRKDAADAQSNLPWPSHPTSPDDTAYPAFIGSFTKGLPHDSFGEVSPSAYLALRKALTTSQEADFSAVPLGGRARLANPQAAYSYSLEGGDSHHMAIPPAPSLNSAWAAGEMTEVYWRAWTRDIPFINYGTDLTIATAAADLTALPDFRGPKTAGTVHPANLFRGPTADDLVGPFISQFLYQKIPFGATTIQQRYRTTASGDNHLTTFAHWLAVQNGAPAPVAATPEPVDRYIANGRDLAEYVHVDFSYQAFQSAALILLGYGSAALDDANPYKTITNQANFVTFGGPMILDLVARVAIEALKAAWYQKWLVHRRLRPEAYSGLVHHHLSGTRTYPLHSSVLNSAVLPLIAGANGSYLLPVAYPEGCPLHPAYPSGHATIAGACVTVLKAFFKESFVIPAPVEASADGMSLLPHAAALTVGGELNKLAANISLGRDTAGVHWRTDGEQGMNLGEEVAIRLLRDHKRLNNEPFTGFSLRRFNGSTVVI